ncbi:MAG: MATE family efflux transporter [Alphaproteobacteria bacterium]|nr:MATE family efflux transporter [Alphaproteobacteria bacterium]USO07444.1 MAG: MATE family efflux transporter [Rhodospirillales bacterium]
MNRPRYDLTDGRLGTHIWRLSSAMGWGILAQNAVQFTDMWFIARLGHDALAAVSFTLPATMLLFYLVLAMSSGMTSAIARASGGRRHEHAARTVSAGIIAGGLIGVLMGAVAYMLMGVAFPAMGVPGAMMPVIEPFMRVWLCGLPFLSVLIVANAGGRGMGESRLPAYVMLLIAAVNLALDPVLIYGLFGLPRMGMTGAALATLLAYVCGMVAALVVAGRHMHLIRFATLRNGPKTRRALATWFKVVIPAAVAYAIEPFAAGILTAIVARAGLDAVAAFGVASRIEGIALIMLMALWGAVTPLTGQNWAARKYDRVVRTIELASIVNGLFCIAFALAMWVFAKPIVGLFSQVPATLALATVYLRIVPVSYVGFGATGVIGAALNGTGRGHFYLVVNLFRVATLLAFAVAGTFYGGFTGFAIGIGAANLLAALAVVVWARRVFLARVPASR